jgi:hypothetical protein
METPNGLSSDCSDFYLRNTGIRTGDSKILAFFPQGFEIKVIFIRQSKAEGA